MTSYGNIDCRWEHRCNPASLCRSDLRRAGSLMPSVLGHRLGPELRSSTTEQSLTWFRPAHTPQCCLFSRPLTIPLLSKLGEPSWLTIYLSKKSQSHRASKCHSTLSSSSPGAAPRPLTNHLPLIGIASVVLEGFLVAPDILGYASTLERSNRFARVGSEADERAEKREKTLPAVLMIFSLPGILMLRVWEWERFEGGVRNPLVIFSRRPLLFTAVHSQLLRRIVLTVGCPLIHSVN